MKASVIRIILGKITVKEIILKSFGFRETKYSEVKKNKGRKAKIGQLASIRLLKLKIKNGIIEAQNNVLKAKFKLNDGFFMFFIKAGIKIIISSGEISPICENNSSIKYLKVKGLWLLRELINIELWRSRE